MEISDKIIRMLTDAKLVPVPVTATSNLYTDLGYDSLAFVKLLLEIEDIYSIRFELLEIGTCLQTDRLISLVERKVRESRGD